MAAKKRKTTSPTKLKPLWVVVIASGPGIVCQEGKSLPLRAYWDRESRAWWTKDGNWEVRKIGCVIEDGTITFGSRHQKEAQLFLDGALAYHQRVKSIL